MAQTVFVDSLLQNQLSTGLSTKLSTSCLLSCLLVVYQLSANGRAPLGSPAWKANPCCQAAEVLPGKSTPDDRFVKKFCLDVTCLPQANDPTLC